MKKNLKKVMYILSATAIISGYYQKKAFSEVKDMVVDIKKEVISIEDIKVVDLDAYVWYTNVSSGIDSFDGKKMFIKDKSLNELLESSYFYYGLYEDEHAFLGEYYTSLQNENSMIHSYSMVPLKSLESVLIEEQMEEYMKSFYSQQELLELDNLLNNKKEYIQTLNK